ncbi:hypothetical protein BH11ACT4_BH11ACT4_13190 [soil metagenome]
MLDATKHQDDKIGRLFTGVSFLTAAALATANLGDPRYLSQKYTEFSNPLQFPPLGILTLAIYLVLVVICVMLLINSLATPLRIPGGRRKPDRENKRVEMTYAGDPDIETSQIYFGEIVRYSEEEWSRKWKAAPQELRRELTESLIRENHNLAVRTQFKYGRTLEAITVFNLALLFLSLTVVLGAAAASADSGGAVIEFPALARWFAASMFGLYLLFQLAASARYSRQTVDEQADNLANGRLRYLLALAAAFWITVLALGAQWVGYQGVFWVGGAWLVASALLFIGTYRATRPSGRKARSKPIVAWVGSSVAVSIGAALSVLVILAANDEASFAAASFASLGWAVSSFISPMWSLRRNRLDYADRKKAKDAPSDPAPPPRGLRRQRAT